MSFSQSIIDDFFDFGNFYFGEIIDIGIHGSPFGNLH